MRRHKPEALRTSHGLCSFFSAKLDEDVLDVRLTVSGAMARPVRFPCSLNGVYADKFHILSEYGERILGRAWRLRDDVTRVGRARLHRARLESIV
jgi:hypothetical protein